MLHAIGLVQDIQLTSFAIIFVLMVARDRANISLRWLAAAYIAGFGGAIFDLGYRWMPDWLSITFGTMAPPVGYACLHAGFVSFVRRGERTRWVSVGLLAGSLPLYLWWSVGKHFQHIGAISTLGDLCLAIQTAFTAWLLLSTRDAETAWPRRVLGVFLSVYSAVEFARVVLFAIIGRLPDRQYPSVELASAIVYVVSCSVLPLGFIWMMNARLHAHMSRQMTTDPLTELLNRRGIDQTADLELARYARSRERTRAFAVVLADIDHFKKLNDAYGHAGGDAALCEVARLLRQRVRENDVAGRLGGEEFVLILPQTSAAEAMQLVERLRAEIENHPFLVGEVMAHLTMSFGVTATSARHDITWSMLLSEADIALYAAKRAGRNLCRLFGKEMIAGEGKTGVQTQMQSV